MPQSLIKVIKNSTGRGASHLRVVLEIEGLFQGSMTHSVNNDKPINLFKSIYNHYLIFIFIFLLPLFGASQTTYTFHTAGDWTDAANWSPSYPGTNLGDVNGYIFEINEVCHIGPSTTLNVNSSCGLVEIYVGYGTPYAHLTIEGDVIIQSGYSSVFVIHSYDDVTFTGDFINNGNNDSGFYNTSNLTFTGNLDVIGTGRTVFTFCTFNSPSIEISYASLPQFGSAIDIYDDVGVDVTNTSFVIGWLNDFIPSIGQNIGVLNISSSSGSISGFNSSNFTIEPVTGLTFTPFISSDNKSITIQVTSPLPIIYQNKPTAKIHNNQSHIAWSVSSQINNEKYIIEHSKNGKTFSSIGEIAGDGTINETKHYEYIHLSPSIGINYYRIKQVDYDGQYSYSDIVSVFVKGEGNDMSIYPNPTKDIVYLSGINEGEYSIRDITNKIVSFGQISTEGISLMHLNAGVYYISLINSTNHQVHRILKI